MSGGFWPFVILCCVSAAAFSPCLFGYFYGDDIPLLTGTSKVSGYQELVQWIFRPWNEHVQPLFKLELYVFWHLFGIRFIPIALFMLAQLIVVEWLVWILSDRWFSSLAARCAMTGLFGTTALYLECVAYPSASTFLTALVFTLLSFAGAEWSLEGHRIKGNLLAFAGGLLSPMASLIGAPSGIWTALYAGFLASLGRKRTFRQRFQPGIYALCGTAVYASIYIAAAQGVISTTEGPGNGLLSRADFHQGTLYAFKALVFRQWGNFAPQPFGGVIIAVSAVLLLAFRKHANFHLLLGFLIWSLGNLLFIFVFRAWCGDAGLLSQRYYLYPSIGAAGLAAMAVECVFRAGEAKRTAFSRWQWARWVSLLAVAAAILGNAGHTWYKSRQHAWPRRRFVAQFCEEWSRLPEAYWRKTGMNPLVIADVNVDIIGFCYNMPLSSYASFCWPRNHEWKVEWTAASEGFSEEFKNYLFYVDDFHGVRHFLRFDLDLE